MFSLREFDSGRRARCKRELHIMLQIMLRILKSLRSVPSVYVPEIHEEEVLIDLTVAYIGQICRDCSFLFSF